MKKSAKPKDRTAPTRKAQERQRKRNQGLVPVELWVKPEHKEAIKLYAHMLTIPQLPIK